MTKPTPATTEAVADRFAQTLDDAMFNFVETRTPYATATCTPDGTFIVDTIEGRFRVTVEPA